MRAAARMLAAASLVVGVQAGASAVAGPVTVADLLAASSPQDWRMPDPENTLYLQ